MELKDIKAIIDLMRKNGLSEFELERSDFKIKLKRPMGAPAGPIQDEPIIPTFPAAAPTAAIAAPAAASPAGAPATPPAVEVKSPMIGTFYRGPSPESADYVEVGTEVKPD